MRRDRRMSKRVLTTALSKVSLRCLVLLFFTAIVYYKHPAQLIFELAVTSSTLLFFAETLEATDAFFIMHRKMPRAECLITSTAILTGLLMLALTFLFDVVIPTVAICAPLFTLMPLIRYKLRGGVENEA